MTPSDAREDSTYDSICAEDVEAVSFAATAAAADLRGSSSTCPDFWENDTCGVYINGADCSLSREILKLADDMEVWISFELCSAIDWMLLPLSNCWQLLDARSDRTFAA